MKTKKSINQIERIRDPFTLNNARSAFDLLISQLEENKQKLEREKNIKNNLYSFIIYMGFSSELQKFENAYDLSCNRDSYLKALKQYATKIIVQNGKGKEQNSGKMQLQLDSLKSSLKEKDEKIQQLEKNVSHWQKMYNIIDDTLKIVNKTLKNREDQLTRYLYSPNEIKNKVLIKKMIESITTGLSLEAEFSKN